MLTRALRKALVAGAGVALMGAAVAFTGATAGAATATLSYSNGGAATVTLNPTNPDDASGLTPVGGPYSSGQYVDLTIPANSVFSAAALGQSGTPLKIWQCTDANGLPSGLPTLNTSCDSNTVQVTTNEADDGSLDIHIPVYSTPDGLIGDTASAIKCDAVNQCVFLITTDQTNLHVLTPPHLFSAPFKVVPSPNDSGTNPGDGTPEVPLTLGLPLLAAAIGGGVVLNSRRRRHSNAG